MTRPPVTHTLGQQYLKRAGWTVSGELPDSPKAVVIAAPHSSNWDLPFMLAVAWTFRMQLNWLGKHTLFEGPGGGLMRRLGGIPVDRRARHGLVEQVATRIREADSMYLAVAPSGTRTGNTRWKSGFYHIAREAGVPIVLGFLDYGRRVGGVGPSLMPSGDVRADMDRIRAFYADIRGHDGKLATGIELAEERDSPPNSEASGPVT
ncbi:MAG: 1-acyl-sn-glycerol-3-phosphate acyltransferase [Polyangiaceae bacterium]|nr:1-acyl-sn-glycerol-3-phosphate acyltransferase [Polyangiaceae bacterium]MCW5790569.1 1-acyl-sn-glycerol-3-phosphate acyltransferase [Polyangiaceae bacterium]